MNNLKSFEFYFFSRVHLLRFVYDFEIATGEREEGTFQSFCHEYHEKYLNNLHD